MKNLIPFFAVVLLSSSCASHIGNISTGTLSGNVVYNDVAVGVAQTGHVLGIGGLSQDALVFEAKRDLMVNKPLTQGEQFTNFTVDFKHSYWLLYAKTKVTLTADVVTVDPSVTGAVYTDKYLTAISSKGLANDFFALGDSVILKSGIKGQIVQIEGATKVRIGYKSKLGVLRTRKWSVFDLYSLTKEKQELKVGGYFSTTAFVERSGKGDPEVLEIAGVGIRKVLVYDKSNKLKKYKHGK